MLKNKIMKKIGAGFMAGLCAFSMLGTGMNSAIQSHAESVSATENDVFPSADEVIAQAATLLGAPYGFGFKGYTGVYYQGGYSPLTEEYIRQQGLDCSGLIYYTMTQLGYKTSGESSIINWTEKIKPWYNKIKRKKVEKKMSGKTKNYTEEFKKQIVMLSKSGRSANSIAKEYGISKSSVTKWVRDFNNSGSFKAKDNRTPEENELIELRKRVKELEMEADILKQAALIMARKSK